MKKHIEKAKHFHRKNPILVSVLTALVLIGLLYISIKYFFSEAKNFKYESPREQNLEIMRDMLVEEE